MNDAEEKVRTLLAEGNEAIRKMSEVRIEIDAYQNLPLPILKAKKREIERKIKELDRLIAISQQKKAELILHMPVRGGDAALRMIPGGKYDKNR